MTRLRLALAARLTVWAGLAVASTTAATAAATAATAEPTVPAQLASIRDTLVLGEWQQAREALHRLADAVGRDHGPQGLVQLGLATPDAFDASLWLPAALLHLDLYREARARRDYAVSTHARDAYSILLQRMANDESTPATATAELCELLGDDLHDAGLLRFSIILYRRAVELDPANLSARLSLAVRLEQLGMDPEAATHYEQILAARPEHDEAALRQAVLLLRLGRVRASRRALESLVAEAQEPWVLSVAYQELARQLLRRDGPAAARDLLRQATSRLPRDPSLTLQLAFVLDTQGQRRAAASVLEQLETAEPGTTAPRHRLSLWIAGTEDDLYDRLRRRADEQLAAFRSEAR